MAWSFEPQGAGKGIPLGCSIDQVTYSAMLTWSATLSIAWGEYESATLPAQHLIFSNWIPNGCCKLKIGNVLAFCTLLQCIRPQFFFLALVCQCFTQQNPNQIASKHRFITILSSWIPPRHAPWHAHFCKIQHIISNKSSPNMTSWNVHTVNIPTLLSQSAWPCMVYEKVTKAKSTYQLLSMLRMLDTAVGKTLVPMEEYHQENHHQIWSCHGCPTDSSKDWNAKQPIVVATVSLEIVQIPESGIPIALEVGHCAKSSRR